MEETEPPFTSTIMDEVMPQRFWIPPVIQYSGSGDLSEHVEAYRSWIGKRSQKPNTHPFAIKQEPKESLKDYIARFNEEALLVEDYDDKITLTTLFSGLKEGKFTFSIGNNRPKTLAKLIARAQKYTNTEEFFNACKNVQVAESNGKGKRPRNEILLDIRGEKLLNWPVCMMADLEHRDKHKYCRFHRDHDHNTADYVDLKDEIKTLIRKGHL
ncbi:uncharacterized protein LOC131232376 [Magnolia sinica]|uniref:uncharacterized protein LOC131232376 n=1 Tax=Magnolia sinica TaxID=86752 RepID=UPI002659F166|nr:uncharacterized protein LOC131232376 [Magnolia sinica]